MVGDEGRTVLDAAAVARATLRRNQRGHLRLGVGADAHEDTGTVVHAVVRLEVGP